MRRRPAPAGADRHRLGLTDPEKAGGLRQVFDELRARLSLSFAIATVPPVPYNARSTGKRRTGDRRSAAARDITARKRRGRSAERGQPEKAQEIAHLGLARTSPAIDSLVDEALFGVPGTA
jgi:hypothetical protein